MTALSAFNKFIKEVRKYPFPDALTPIREKWEELSRGGYFVPQDQPWFSAFQLANLVKFLVLFGAEKPRRPTFDLGRPFNFYKDFWAAAESEANYSNNSDYLAAFIFRFLYQQLPYFIHRNRVPQLFGAVRELYLTPGLDCDNSETWSGPDFEAKFGVPMEAFFRVSQHLWEFFASRLNADEDSLVSSFADSDRRYVRPTLEILAGSRSEFEGIYQNARAESFREIPYEFNPLLRLPIIAHKSKLWAPVPELIAYAATRGLFFQLSDSFGERFKKRFGDIFSEYAAHLFLSKLGQRNVLTEADERRLGWQGKTNDFTVLTQKGAFLFECKASALFLGSKREASAENLATDIQKNLANRKHRAGVFQLYDKIQAIKNEKLPAQLGEVYNSAAQLFPVMLIYDRIGYANHPKTLRNLVDAELAEEGIQGFDYQIWHAEETEHLLEIIPSNELPSVLEEKFVSSVFRYWDLDTFLFEKTHRRFQYLRVSCCVPKGEAQALKIIRSLADGIDVAR